MSSRQRDQIRVESSEGVFDRYSSLEITNDIVGPTEATLELGDDTAWPELSRMVAPGKEWRVVLNGQPRLKGRAEVNEVPASATGGIGLSLTIRTKLSDARFNTADEKIRVEKSSVKDFVLACYEPLGYSEPDFLFAPFTARDLLTGAQGGGGSPADLEPLKVDQAKVQPGETIYDAVERHLGRFHATHWDAPDGRIVVGVPDDTQAPLYRLQAKRGAASRGNNLLSVRRIRDWSEVARSVTVTGQDRGQTSARKRVRATAVDDDVDAVASETGHFNRQLLVSGSQARQQSHAEALAQRELSVRQRRKSGLEAKVDGWSFWDGSQQIPWANDTTTNVDIDAFGVESKSRYLITRVTLALSTTGSATTSLTMVSPGIWIV